MLKKLVTRFITVIIITAIIAPITVFPSGAATVKWDGKSKLVSGNTYKVSKKITVSGDLTVPKGAKLRVVSGGKIIFTSGAKVTVRGELAIAQKGEVYLSGGISVRSGGLLNVYGTLLSSVNSKIDMSGSMTVFSKGVFKSSGVYNLYLNTTLTNRGTVNILPSGSFTFSGDVYNEKRGEIRNNGKVSITKSGSLRSAGEVNLRKKSTFKNSGLIIFEKASTLKGNEEIKNTKSGSLTDNRGGVDYSDMYASALAKEPDVTLYGIDVSRWNGDIDWKKVAESGFVEFAMIKVGTGTYDGHDFYEDIKFKDNIQGAQENGIEVGLYIYSYATTVAEIKREARALVKFLKDYKFTYPLALDMEEDAKKYTDKPQKMAEAFLEIVMDAGYFPMIYSYKSWLEDNLDDGFREKYAVWVAHWGVKFTTYMSGYQVWQYSDVGKVSGIKGDVDLNIAYKDFAKYIKKKKLNNL